MLHRLRPVHGGAGTPPAQVGPAERARTAVEAGDGGGAGQSRSSWRLIAAAFFENKLARVGLGFIVLEVGFCFIGPLVYHTDQLHSSITAINLAPSLRHPLGTDNNGFDILGRLMAGGRSTLEISFAVAVCATVLGMLWGALSGFVGGLLDALMSRVLDVLISIPPLFVFIYLATVYRPTLPLLIVVLSALSWLIPARLVRGETLSVRTREYVQAARIMGSRAAGIMRHIIQNVIGTIVVSATFQITNAILILATLDFFGFGLPPPTPTWGGMLSNGINYLYDGYWWQIYPVAALIVCTVVAISFIGDALRDAFEVRLQPR